MDQNNDQDPALPTTENQTNAEFEKACSAFTRKMGSLYRMQQTFMSIYNGLVNSNKFTEEFARSVEAKAYSLYEDLNKTEIGKKADETLTTAAATTRKMCHHSPIAQLGMQLFHLCFRFFLPLLLLRWWVDGALACTELALALTQDFVRTRTSSARLPMGNSKESEETGEKQLDKEKKDEASKEPHLIKFLSTTWWDVIVYFISLVYYLTKLYAIFFCIPYLSYQWYFLNAASCTLHRLAGLDYEDEHKDTASRNAPATVFENSIIGERKLRSRHWVADAVLNRIISRMMDTPLVGLFLEMAGLKRELNLFRRIQKAFEGTSFSVTIRESGVPIRLLAVLTDINRLVDGELAPYLNLDNTYKEEDDPDYEPTDSSDDSLNENEHVKAINGNGSNGLKRVEESAKIGMKDNKTSPARQLEETTSPADKDAQPSASGGPDTGSSLGTAQGDPSQDTTSSKSIKCTETQTEDTESALDVPSTKKEGSEETRDIVNTGDKDDIPDSDLSPLQQERRDKFLSCLAKITDTEFAEDLADNLKWAKMDPDNIEKLTGLLTSPNKEDKQVESAAAPAPPETPDCFQSGWSVGTPPDLDEVDPDIAALLASNTPLETLSVRSGEIITSSPASGLLVPIIRKDLFHVDPANQPLPPSPALDLSPVGKARRPRWRNQRSGWPAHAVCTIDEEDEQVSKVEANSKDGISSPDDSYDAEEMDQDVLENKEDKTGTVLNERQRSQEETDEKVETEEICSSEPQIVQDVQLDSSSSPAETPPDVDQSSDTANPKTDEQTPCADSIEHNEFLVPKPSENASKTNGENQMDKSNVENDYPDVEQEMSHQELHEVAQTKQNELTSNGKDTSVDNGINPSNNGIGKLDNNGDTPESFRSVNGMQCLGESVSSPVSSLPSLPPYEEDKSKSVFEDRQLTTGVTWGMMVNDSEKYSTCTDVDTGIAFTDPE